jgi:hypothetical protein
MFYFALLRLGRVARIKRNEFRSFSTPSRPAAGRGIEQGEMCVAVVRSRVNGGGGKNQRVILSAPARFVESRRSPTSGPTALRHSPPNPILARLLIPNGGTR